MTKRTHTCANPCEKGKAGGCSGACAIDFLGFETGARSVRAKIGKNDLPTKSEHLCEKDR